MVHNKKTDTNPSSLLPFIKYSPAIICILLSAFFVYFPITDSDIFWHLAAGREIIAQKHLLFTDPFAFTLDHPKWIDLHWLFQLLVFGLYSIGSLKALLVFKVGAVAVTCALLCLAHRSYRYVMITSFISALLIYEVRYLIDIRPVLVTMLCMAAFFVLFEKARSARNRHYLWLCVPIQILWTNSQGLYMIGLFIIGTYWVESVALFAFKKERKPLLESVILLFAAASCVINPYGWGGIALPFELFSRITPAIKNIYSLNISENVPLMALSGYESVYRHTVIISAIAAVCVVILNRKRARIAHVLLFAGFLVLAFLAVRNVLLYIIAVIPLIGYNASHARIWDLSARLTDRSRRFIIPLTSIAAVAIMLVPIIRHATVLAICPPNREISPFRFPEKIAAFLEQHPGEGEMFNDIRYGGYLIWNFYPQKKVFIDGRLIIRSPAFFAEFLALDTDTALFETTVDRWKVTQVLLPFAVFDRYHFLINHLYNSSKWQLEYTDGASVLFVRRGTVTEKPLDLSDPATVNMVMDSIKAEWRNAPYVQREGLGYLAGLLETVGERGEAERVRAFFNAKTRE